MKYSDICNADSALQKGTLPQENGGFGGDGGETIEEKLHSESYRCTRKEKSILVKKKKEMTISTTSAQRVPDTRPKPKIFFNPQSIPEFFSESSGISGIGYFRK